jgi:hypothetical protein
VGDEVFHFLWGDTMSRHIEVGYTIRDQIIRPDPAIPMSWGMNSLTTTNNAGTLGGLTFKVNGRKLKKGRVSVELMPDDTYRVRFYNVRKRCVQGYTDVYCDQLVHVIDTTVET